MCETQVGLGLLSFFLKNGQFLYYWALCRALKKVGSHYGTLYTVAAVYQLGSNWLLIKINLINVFL